MVGEMGTPNPEPRPEITAIAAKAKTLLRLQDATSLAGSLGKLLIGAGVSFGGGVIVASFITGILDLCVGSSGIGWSGWFLVYVVVFVPVVIWQERKTRENYLDNMIGRIDPNPSSHGELRMNRMAVWVGMISSALVFGPRSLVDGFRGMRGGHTIARQAVFERASILAADLAAAPGGVPIKQLIHPPEDMRTFGSAVDLLDTHGWTGKSKDGASIWISSLYRGKLESEIRALRQG